MNATEDDQPQPVGEGPIDTLTAIERGAVLGILSAADAIAATGQLAERQARAIEKVRAALNDYPGDLMVSKARILRILDEAGA